MKILYVANDRNAAMVAGATLRTIAPDVSVPWCVGLDAAWRWISDHRDVAALILELDGDPASYDLFVSQVTGLGVNVPVVVVPLKDPAPPLTGLEPIVDAILPKSPTFQKELPGVLAHALRSPRPAARPSRAPWRILYVGEAGLARECFSRPGVLVTQSVPVAGRKFNPLPDGTPEDPLPVDTLLIEHAHPGVDAFAILRDIAARKLDVQAVVVADWNEEFAALSMTLGAIDYIAKSKTSFRGFFLRLVRQAGVRQQFQRQLRDARAEAASRATASDASTHEEMEQRLADARRAIEQRDRQLAGAGLLMQQADDHFALLESRIVAAETELQTARDRHAAEVRDADARLEDYRLRVDARLAQAAAAEEALQAQLVDAAAMLQRAEQQAADDRHAAGEDAARRRGQFEIELAEEVARRQTIEKRLAETEATLGARLNAVETELTDRQSASERAQRRWVDEIEAMRQRARDHDARMEERAARERAAWEHTLAERTGQIQQLQQDGDRLRQSLAESERDVRRLEAGLADLHRQIDTLPVSLCRANRDGVVTWVNQALAEGLGYGAPADLLRSDFATTVFESGDELPWIVNRCLDSRSSVQIETTWKRKDASRVIVRLLATAAASGEVDIAVQDLTAVRALEERLRNSQRMEAVARYASEVAVTCGNLLLGVKREGQDWLAAIDSDIVRRRGELVLAELSRAAGFLRQLAIYGDEQTNASDLVDVNRVLRELAPVMKRVARGNIELMLPPGPAPLTLDVEAEQLERILINVAAYGRQRMPRGGRLMIEVGSVVVDRSFVATYPNVRPGAHVLLTVTEVRDAALADALGDRLQTETPGVDLAPLQALVNDCGGHLWVTVEPGGMVLKIRLPRRELDSADAAEPAKRPA
jgi:nitrogen-specific signal transduction histidine kinase